MDALEMLQKIQELKEIYGDIEVMVKLNSEGNEFFEKIIDIDLQAGTIGEEGKFVGGRIILVTCG